MATSNRRNKKRARRRPTRRAPSPPTGEPTTPRAVGGPITTRAVGGPIGRRAVGGPITPRAVGGPITPRAVGGPITPRAVGGPIAPRMVPPPRVGDRSARQRAADVEAGPVVVYIHGIGNKPAPAVLKRQYDQALFGIDMGSKTRLAYWADIRYPQPLQSGGAESATIPASDGPHPLGADGRLSA